MNKIVIMGATSGIGLAVAERLAAQADILSVLGTEEAWTLAVYAADGTLRASYSGTADSTVGIPQLPAGVYIARVATAGATATLRFLRR